MICKGCGNDIPGNQVFCPNCGMRMTGNQMPDYQTVDQTPSYKSVQNQQAPYQTVNQAPNYQSAQNQQMPYQAGSQASNYQGTQNQQMPYQAGSQAPNYQGTQNQQMPYQAGSQAPNYQGTQNQQMPYQEVNQMPNYQGAQNQMGNGVPLMSPMNSYHQNSNKKNNKILLLTLIGVLSFIFLIVVAIVVTGFIGYMTNKNNKQELTDTFVSDTIIDPITEDSTDITDNSPINGAQDSGSDNSSNEITGNATEESKYNIVYSYTELPDVISIDSDSRFTYYNWNSEADVITYTYSFRNNATSEEEFYKAVDDYCSLLMIMNNFYYEEDFSVDQYNETGLLTDYFSKDNTAIGITASVESDGWYVYIDIYDLSADISTTDDGISEELYSNYSYYLDGRESKTYDLATEVVMENGIAFYLNEAIVSDLGDGTAQIDCKMYLAAAYADTYLYTDSFLLLPMDSEGYMIGDARLIENILDETGQYQFVPYLLSTENYYEYTVSFIVPAETTSFSVYGTNLTDGFTVGPTYYIDMVVDQY